MKRIPSNRMPKYVEPEGNVFGVVILGVFLSILVYAAWPVPWYVSTWFAAAALAVFTFKHFEKRRIAEDRSTESICSFARSFDFRNLDTWIIRATYEAIQRDVKYSPRKTDTFAFLGLDDGLEEIAEKVAQRTGRPLTNCEQNPWYGKVETVGDMVEFFMCQLRQLEAAS